MANKHVSKKSGNEDFGFLLTSQRQTAKKKDREKDCVKDLTTMLDQLPINKMDAWYQMEAGTSSKPEAEQASELHKLSEKVKEKYPRIVLELPEPAAHVLVASVAFCGHDKAVGPDPEVSVLDKFDPGFAELLKEARRVSGMVRKQWFVATVLAKADVPLDANQKPFYLGMGMATDRALARTRALHAASIRLNIVTEAMLPKAGAPGSQAPAPAAIDAPASSAASAAAAPAAVAAGL